MKNEILNTCYTKEVEAYLGGRGGPENPRNHEGLQGEGRHNFDEVVWLHAEGNDKVSPSPG